MKHFAAQLEIVVTFPRHCLPVEARQTRELIILQAACSCPWLHSDSVWPSRPLPCLHHAQLFSALQGLLLWSLVAATVDYHIRGRNDHSHCLPRAVSVVYLTLIWTTTHVLRNMMALCALILETRHELTQVYRLRPTIKHASGTMSPSPILASSG